MRDLPEAVIVLAITALNPFTGTVLSSVRGATRVVGVTGLAGWTSVGFGGGATDEAV